jgi:hypothetical protein
MYDSTDHFANVELLMYSGWPGRMLHESQPICMSPEYATIHVTL